MLTKRPERLQGFDYFGYLRYFLTICTDNRLQIFTDAAIATEISAQLLDTRTRSVVWSHTASETVPVEKRDIRGVVGSLSAAARTAADRLLKSMTEELLAALVQTGREAKTEILDHTISTSKEARLAQ